MICFSGMTLPTANILFALRESNTPGIVIVLVLFAWSIVAWSVMVSKLYELRRAARQSDKFIQAFRKDPDPFALYLRNRRFRGSPAYEVYKTGCLSIGGELEDEVTAGAGDLFPSSSHADRFRLTSRQLESARGVVERHVTDATMMLEDKMGILATSVSACPFLGLLGTVWGVMDAFGGMAATGSATLSAVAPGISGALLTTVVGLLVALPSAIGYNVLTNRIRKMHVFMDNFGQEFLSAVQRNYLGDA